MKTNFSLKNYSTFGVDAFCKNLYLPRSCAELVQTLSTLDKTKEKYKVIGNGSNILFYKKCKKTTIVCTRKMAKRITFKNGFVTFSASCTLADAFAYCLQKGLSGFEKLALIPGTIGGAVVGNAGCDGDEIFDRLVSIKVYHNGKVFTMKKEEVSRSYRDTFFKANPSYTILSAKFSLPECDKKALLSTFIFSRQKRQEKQPFGKCGGSTFKNFSSVPAGKLIEKCALKGRRIGGACISFKHANFIINDKNASSKDIVRLIDLCKKSVKKKFNMTLKEEIEIF